MTVVCYESRYLKESRIILTRGKRRAGNATSVPLREITANQDHDEEGIVPFSLASMLILQGKYNDKERRALRVATRTPISQFAFSAFCSQANNDFITALIRYK